MSLDAVINDRQQDLLGRYVERVRSSPHNLLSRRALEEIWERHVGESVHFARRLPTVDHAADLGSGGGFPGLVVAIVRPELTVTLIEATTKKAVFLSETAEALELGNVRVVNARAEEREDLAGAFPLVMARAVGSLEVLLDVAVPLLQPGGRLYAIKGSRWRKELQEAGDALRDHEAVVEEIPDTDDPTTTVGPLVVILRRPATEEGSPQ